MTNVNCPFCQQPNQCMVNSDQLCWCASVSVADELIDLLPTEHGNRSCICSGCIQLFNIDPEAFTLRYKAKK